MVDALTRHFTGYSVKKFKKNIRILRRNFPRFIAIVLIVGCIFLFVGIVNLKSYYAGPAYRAEIPEEIAVGWDHGVNFTDMEIMFFFQEHQTKMTMLDINYKFRRQAGSLGTETFAILLPFNVIRSSWIIERLRKGVGGTLVYTRIHVGENSSDQVEGGVNMLLNQSIWYDNRGIYSAAVNFGEGSEDLQSFMRALGVSVSLMQPAKYKIYVEIASIINIQTIPIAHIVPTEQKKNPAVLWEMSRLESVVVSYTNLNEVEDYQMRLFYSGLFLGLGIPIITSGLFELSRKLIRQRDCIEMPLSAFFFGLGDR